MIVPDTDHPIWTILQMVVAAACLSVLAEHGLLGGHTGGVDPADGVGLVVGLVGGGLALKVGCALLKGVRRTP